MIEEPGVARTRWGTKTYLSAWRIAPLVDSFHSGASWRLRLSTWWGTINHVRKFLSFPIGPRETRRKDVEHSSGQGEKRRSNCALSFSFLPKYIYLSVSWENCVLVYAHYPPSECMKTGVVTNSVDIHSCSWDIIVYFSLQSNASYWSFIQLTRGVWHRRAAMNLSPHC